MLVLWIPLTFYVVKRFPLSRAVLICFLGGLMLLPVYVSVKIPFMPGLDKLFITNIALVLAVLFLRRERLNRHRERWWLVATVGMGASSYLSGHTNQDALHYGPLVLPGHDFKDTMNLVVSALLGVPLASWLGIRCFRDGRDLKRILIALAGAGLLYSIPILIELRMSPQIHVWVYGYGSYHQWGQLIRYGGYRPLVMMGHGLVLSLFMLAPTVAATALARVGGWVRGWPAQKVAWWLILIVGLCKSTGVWLYAAISLPLVRWARAKVMLRVALTLVVITSIYPMLRADHTLPVEKVLEFGNRFGDERRESLQVRFDNEDILLEKAMLRPWFGWGGYGRSRVFNDEGIDVCITDGEWILVLGSSGYVGAFFYYLFTLAPMWIAARRIPRLRNRQHRTKLAALVLLCAFLWFDNLPNAPGFLICQFLLGAVCSISHTLLAEERKEARQRMRAHGRGPLAVAPVPAA